MKLIKIKSSAIHGKGAFAALALPKGTPLPAFVKIGTSGTEKDWIRSKLGRYINHSPNANTVPFRMRNAILLVTRKKIRKGEELTVNYMAVRKAIDR
jgi:SET domain-containing protein